MQRLKPVFIHRAYFMFVALLLCSSCKNDDVKEVSLKVTFMTNINNQPQFLWTVDKSVIAFKQAAVQIVIKKNDEDSEIVSPVAWDSGYLPQTTNRFNYQGECLEHGTKYYARVKVWSQDGRSTRWSTPIFFHIPIAYPRDWQAQWISYAYDEKQALPVFRKSFKVKHPERISSARFYIAAPGFYEAFFNGERIGENVLDPGQTNYDDYTYYTAYDVSINPRRPQQVIDVMLGNGWYNQNEVWGRGMVYGQPLFIAQLQLKYNDGTQETIGTDEHWQWQYGPITFSNIYAGETYDANRELTADPECNPNGEWQQAVLSKIHPCVLIEQCVPPIKKMKEMETYRVIRNSDSSYVFDFGQNFAGWVKLKIKGKKGQKITIRLVEELTDKGEIDVRTTGFRATKVIQTQTYVCKGEGIEEWEPKFTYFGFRYAEVTGLTTEPDKNLLKGIVLYSSMPKTGYFECSEPAINKLHQLADWTLKSNMHGVPTDCPHREKCGWTGDVHALAKSLIYNYDAHQFLNKYIFDMRSSGRNTNKELYFGENFHDRSVIAKPKGIPTMIVPGRRTSGIASPDWGTAVVQLPWYNYLYYGDEFILREFYPDMKIWVEYVHGISVDGLIPHGLGDWCPPGGNENIECPVKLSSTAFHILDLKLMSKIAGVLGKELDEYYYSTLLDRATEAFNIAFYNRKEGSYGSQTANAMALSIGICPQQERQRVARAIIDDMYAHHHGFISTGIFGISRLFHVLSECGFEDEVYRLLTKKGEHSFAYMWETYDATTLWEVLPLSRQSGELHYRSHNHPMQGGYDAWFFSGIGGITPDETKGGFKTMILKPYLTHYLSHAKVTYQSVYGRISSKWERRSDVFEWSISIPNNTSAEIYIPSYDRQVKIWVNEKEMDVIKKDKCFSFLGEFASGNYRIVVKEMTMNQ